MSNRTNIDLGTFYCPTARARQSILRRVACGFAAAAFLSPVRGPFACAAAATASLTLEKLFRNLLTFIITRPSRRRVSFVGGEYGTRGRPAGRKNGQRLSLKLLFLCPTNEATNDS